MTAAASACSIVEPWAVPRIRVGKRSSRGAPERRQISTRLRPLKRYLARHLFRLMEHAATQP